MAKRFVPNLSQIKVLITVYELNEKDIYPLQEGVNNILLGIEKEYDDISTYSTLTSYSGKKISRLSLLLIRYGYLKKRYHEETDKMYLMVTEYGRAQAIKYLSRHKNPFKKHTKKKKNLFVEIKK